MVIKPFWSLLLRMHGNETGLCRSDRSAKMAAPLRVVKQNAMPYHPQVQQKSKKALRQRRSCVSGTQVFCPA